MKHTIRLFLVLAALIAGSAGTVQAGTSDLAIVNQVAAADATIKTYVSGAVPNETTLGTEATTIKPGKYLVIEVTPADGKWTYSDLFKIEKGVGIGGAESRPRRASGDMNLGESPTALTTNKADGSGIYYYQIPTSWTDATAVFIHGSAIDKINLSTATASSDGKTFTTADRTDGWKATITLNEVNFTYNSSTAQGPTISSISVTNGTKTMSTIADHVSIIDNSQTNANSYNATLTAVATGCLKGSKTVPFKIAKAPTEITLNTPPGGGEVGQMNVDDTYTILNSFTPAEAGSLTYTLDKESVVTVDASGEVTAVGEGEVTITVSFAGNDNYAAAEDKTMKIKVSKVPTEITFDPPYPNTEREGQLNVLDEYGGATLTPAEAGSLTYTYTPADGSVVTIDNGKIKAVGAGTATITASFAGNNKYAAAVSKTITVNVSLYDASLAFGNVTKTFGDADFTPSPSTKTSDGAITFTSGNTNVITVSSDGKLSIVAASTTPVTITANQAASGSFNATTAEFTVTVNKAASSVNAPTPKTGLTYKGTPLELITGGSATGGTIEYSLNGSSWSTDIPTGTEAKTYTVYYQVKGDGNHTDIAAQSFNVTISSNGINANGSGTGDGINGQIVLGGVPEGGFTYDGNPHKPTVTVKDGNGNTIPEGEYTVSYKDSQGNPVTAPTNAGTYNVVVTDNTGGNYNVSGETTFTIKQATLTITAKDQKVTFGTDIATGTDQVTVTGLQGSDALSEIKLNQSTKDVSTNGTITPSQAVIKNGTTDVTTNYAISFTDGHLTINSKGVNADGSTTATGTIELGGVPEGGFIYDGNPHKPTVTVKDDSGNVIPADQYNVSYKDSKGQPVTNPTEADTYTVVITDRTGTGFDNYTVTGETTFKINAANGELAFDNVTKTFSDEAFTVTPKTDDNKGAITFTSGNTNVITVGSDGKLSIVGAGEATITANQAANGSYNASSTTFTVTVNPKSTNADGSTTATGTIELGGVPEGDFTYDGESHVPTVIVKDGNGSTIPEGEYTVSYKDSEGNPVTAPTNAGTYNVVVTDNTGGNYTVTGETTFTIKKATPQLVFENIIIPFGTYSVTPEAFTKESDGEITLAVEEGETSIQTDGKILTIEYVGEPTSISDEFTITANQAATKNYTATSTTFTISFSQQDININTHPNVEIHLDGKPANKLVFKYIGESITPEVEIFVQGVIIPKEDYNTDYSDNKNVGKAKISVRPNPNAPIAVKGEIQFPIEKADLTISVNDVEKVYGEEDPVFTFVHGTLYGSDKLTGRLLRESGEDAGTYKINQGTLDLDNNTKINYNIKFYGGNLTIKPKTLTITADAKTKIIDEKDPVLTYTSEGLVGTDKISGKLTRDEGENLGTYAIRQGSLSAGNNYSISYTGANLTIKPEVISITAKNDWFTFSNNRDVTLPDGLTVNTCLLDPTGTKAMYYVVSDDQLTVNGQRVLKGGNGVLLHGKAGTTYEFTVIGTTKVSGNAKSYGATQLIPVIEETHFNKGQIFVLSSNKFVPILDTNTKVPARRAVLWLASGTSAARELSLVDSGTTGITTVNSTDSSDAWYTLDGRKLDEKPTKKGLYILNGRKVVIR